MEQLSRQLHMLRQKYGFSAAFLKWFAAISMIVDHTGATVISHLRYSKGLTYNTEFVRNITIIYKLMRRFGRIAFPLYCFMIVEGYFHTRNVKRYAQRLFIFALISEYPFDFALHHGQKFMDKQNVYFTLLIGLLVIWTVDELLKGYTAAQLLVMIVALFFVKALRTDYNYHGVFLIELLYITHFLSADRKGEPKQTGLMPPHFWQGACSAAYLQYYEKMPTPIASLLMFLYNGKRGRQPKWFFYLYYPAHLMLLGIITHIILPRFGI